MLVRGRYHYNDTGRYNIICCCYDDQEKEQPNSNEFHVADASPCSDQTEMVYGMETAAKKTKQGSNDHEENIAINVNDAIPEEAGATDFNEASEALYQQTSTAL